MKQKTQYKITSVGLIPSDWGVKKFTEIFYIFPTASYSRADLTDSDETLYMHYGDIHTKYHFHIDVNSAQLPTVPDDKVKNYELVKEGDLIISDASEDYEGVGKAIEVVNLGEKKMISGLHTFHVREKMPVFAKLFKGYVSLHEDVVKQYRKLATGTKVYSISKDSLLKIQIPLPPIPEQQKIAKILSTWDKAIQQTQSLIEKLELRNKALAFSLLRGQLVKKNSKKISLSKFLTFTPREIEKPQKNYLALGIRSYGKGIFHKTDFDPKAISMEKLYEVKENDFIVNITFAWEHAVAIISKEDEGGLVSHRFPTYVINQKMVSVDFFRHLILQRFFRQMLDNISPGGAGRNRVLSKKDLLKIEISVPSLEEQSFIAEVLNTANKELKQYQEKLKALNEQKKGLMQQLLTGKVRTI